MNKFINLFNRNNKNYDKAKQGLNNIKKKFECFVLAFPDVTPDEIMLIKNKWETLPNNVGAGVKVMALNFKDNIKDLLTEYEPNSYIQPHTHNNEYVIGRIIKGSIINELTGEIYNEGDEYTVSPKETYYMLSSNKGCLIHSVITTNGKYKLKKIPKNLLNKLEVA